MDRESVTSWPAIFAGAAVALATSIFLTLLAAGFGLSVGYGGLASRASLATFTPEMGAWAIAIQVIAGGLGGYLAGRLRHHWLTAHADEAHFRDTAQGLVAWALATIAGVVLAVTVFTPYAAALAPMSAVADIDPARAANIAAQSAFFAAVGMLLSAFVAAVAGRIGGLRSEEMVAKGRT